MKTHHQPDLRGGNSECGACRREGWQAHVDAEGRQGDDKAQQTGEGNRGGRNAREWNILWSAGLCQRHRNARSLRSASQATCRTADEFKYDES
jgi:hypothetical protein